VPLQYGQRICSRSSICTYDLVSGRLYDRAVARGDVLPIPTSESPDRLQQMLAPHGRWFYRYSFSNGVETEPPDPVTQAVHDARARLIFPVLDGIVADRWSSTECVDLACHEGWFSMQLAARGASRVVGLDIRPEHIKKANAIRDIAGLSNVTFEEADLFSLNGSELGSFNVTLFLGLLYHLDNPVGALRIARSLTRDVCVIETQVARPAPHLDCLWGSGAPRTGPAVAAVASDPVHGQAGHGVALVPTLDALLEILTAVGFREAHVVDAPAGEFPQFAEKDRVVVFASA
jgi:tRNA (mo5U34)-methyltransferase